MATGCLLLATWQVICTLEPLLVNTSGGPSIEIVGTANVIGEDNSDGIDSMTHPTL